tara:strand:+ start:545 stop:655 length:111 start_codon:yes stop_codon:yes gene_type:complete
VPSKLPEPLISVTRPFETTNNLYPESVALNAKGRAF